MKTKPLPINDVREYYFNQFYTTLEATKGYKFERLTECLLFAIQSKTGLRISDVLELKYDNITYKKLDTYLEIVIKKTKQPLTIPIDRLMFKMLQDYKQYIILEFNVANDFILFNYKTNKLFTYMWCNKRINALNNSGALGEVFKNVGTHSIRKGLAEYLYNKTDLRTTQYLLGHKSMRTTEIYLELDKEQHLKVLREAL